MTKRKGDPNKSRRRVHPTYSLKARAQRLRRLKEKMNSRLTNNLDTELEIINENESLITTVKTEEDDQVDSLITPIETEEKTAKEEQVDDLILRFSSTCQDMLKVLYENKNNNHLMNCLRIFLQENERISSAESLVKFFETNRKHNSNSQLNKSTIFIKQEPISDP